VDNFKKRILTSIILIFITVLAVVFYPVCGIVVTLFIIIALMEFFDMVENKGVRIFKSFGIIVGGLIPVSIYFKLAINETIQFLFVIAGLFTLFLLELTKKKNYEAVLSISATIFGILYISWCFSFLIRIRQLPQGIWLAGFLLSVTKASDIGAYFLGKFYGKTPLIKRISPYKSLEGAGGGLLLSIFVGLLFYFFMRDIFSFGETIFLSSVLAIISQLGDLFESLIKRDCNLKDSSTILPGLGGLLDTIDSIIFTAPTFYLYVVMVR